METRDTKALATTFRYDETRGAVRALEEITGYKALAAQDDSLPSLRTRYQQALEHVDQSVGLALTQKDIQLLSLAYAALAKYSKRFYDTRTVLADKGENSASHSLMAVMMSADAAARSSADMHDPDVQKLLQIMHNGLLVHDMGEALGEFSSFESSITYPELKADRKNKNKYMAEHEVFTFIIRHAAEAVEAGNTPEAQAAFFATVETARERLMASSAAIKNEDGSLAAIRADLSVFREVLGDLPARSKLADFWEATWHVTEFGNSAECPPKPNDAVYTNNLETIRAEHAPHKARLESIYDFEVPGSLITNYIKLFDTVQTCHHIRRFSDGYDSKGEFVGRAVLAHETPEETLGHLLYIEGEIPPLAKAAEASDDLAHTLIARSAIALGYETCANYYKPLSDHPEPLGPLTQRFKPRGSYSAPQDIPNAPFDLNKEACERLAGMYDAAAKAVLKGSLVPDMPLCFQEKNGGTYISDRGAEFIPDLPERAAAR